MTNEKKIRFFCGAGHFNAHYFMLMFPTLALWIEDDFGLTRGQSLNLGFWMYLLLGVMALPMGAWADRWRSAPLLAIMLLGEGIAAIVCGLSSGPLMLTFGLAAIGLFASIYHPAGIGLISKCSENRGKSLGFNGVCGNLGIGLGPFAAGVLAHVFSWRISFLVSGGLTLLVGILMLFSRINEAPFERAVDTSEKRSSAAANAGYFILMLGCMMLLGLTYRGTVVSLPGYFKEKIGFVAAFFTSSSELKLSGMKSFGASVLIACVYLFGVFGQVLGGRLADRLDLRKGYFLFHLLSLPFMIVMGFAGGWWLFLAAMAYVFFALGMQPIENSLIARLTPDRIRSLAYGLKFMVVLGVGSVAVKFVEMMLDRDLAARIYLVQAGLIALVVVMIAILYHLSRRYSFRNT